jgi:hypothetical protein
MRFYILSRCDLQRFQTGDDMQSAFITEGDGWVLGETTAADAAVSIAPALEAARKGALAAGYPDYLARLFTDAVGPFHHAIAEMLQRGGKTDEIGQLVQIISNVLGSLILNLSINGRGMSAHEIMLGINNRLMTGVHAYLSQRLQQMAADAAATRQ